MQKLTVKDKGKPSDVAEKRKNTPLFRNTSGYLFKNPN
jgi:hypothetical protein